jgi:hypothetical protein
LSNFDGTLNFSKRSRSPNQTSKNKGENLQLADEFCVILNNVCKELHLENFEEIIGKIKEIKD